MAKESSQPKIIPKKLIKDQEIPSDFGGFPNDISLTQNVGCGGKRPKKEIKN